MKAQLLFPQLISWTFGATAVAIGIINTFWGNDPGYGIFILLLSTVYFPPVSNIINEKLSFGLVFTFKLLLAMFILWTALGVGELFDKIELMSQSL